MKPRYTIELSIRQINEKGDLEVPGEIAGVTMDLATTNLDVLEGIMDQCYQDADNLLIIRSQSDDVSPRRPDEVSAIGAEQEEEEEEE